MKYSDLQSKNLNELEIMLKESNLELGKLKFQLTAKTLKDHSQIKKTKKNSAKILTAINKNLKNKTHN